MLYKGKIYLGSNCDLKPKVMSLVHDSPLGGHSSYLKTFHRVKGIGFEGSEEGFEELFKRVVSCVDAAREAYCFPQLSLEG